MPGWPKGADVWPQVSCRPLSFSMTMVEPFTLNTNPVFAELMPRPLGERRAAYADPAWRQRVRDAWDCRAGRCMPRWDTYEIMESAAHPELIGRNARPTSPTSGASIPFDAAARPHPRRARARSCGCEAVLANDDVDGVELLLHEDHCTLGLSDAGAHVGQLCDAVAGHRPARAAGCATAACSPWRRRSTSSPRCRPTSSASTTAASSGPAPGPTSWCSTPTRSPPGPLRRVADFPAGAERLTADQPTGMRHLLVNGTVVQRDGAFRDEAVEQRPGRVVRPDPRA